MPITDLQFDLSVGARTERGHRSENQDQMTGFSCPAGFVYLVADGMGGHRGGMAASRIVTEVYRQQLAGLTSDAPWPRALQQATAAVHAELLRVGSAAESTNRGMGSTVALLALLSTPAGQNFLVGHIGDSRVYLLRHAELRRLTGDHSVVQRMVEENLLTPDEARCHPQSNILTRALGQQESVALEVSAGEPLQDGDIFLLCSDGLWGSLPDDLLAELLAAQLASGGDLASLADQLVNSALEHGSEDNITVQLIGVSGSPAPVAAPPVSSVASPRWKQIVSFGLALVAAVLLGVGAWLATVRGWAVFHQRQRGTAPVVVAPVPANHAPVTQPRPAAAAIATPPREPGRSSPSSQSNTRQEPKPNRRSFP